MFLLSYYTQLCFTTDQNGVCGNLVRDFPFLLYVIHVVHCSILAQELAAFEQTFFRKRNLAQGMALDVPFCTSFGHLLVVQFPKRITHHICHIYM